MSQLIYFLCALTSAACAWMLLSRYHRSGHRLLFWSGLCFGVMTINNIILVMDKVVFPEADLSLLRQSAALVAVALLLYGLIYEKQ